MTNFLKPALAAGLAAAATFAAPAAAQVNGIATLDVPRAIAASQARNTAYQQIATQYQAQRTTIEQRTQQRQTLVQTFDTNSDGQIDETEAAATQDPNNATVRQIQAIDAELQQLQAPIQLARVYVVSQLGNELSNALQQVISDRSIQMVISPDAMIYEAEGANVTEAVVNALNTRVPAIAAVPPADWQPSENGVNLFQQVQQILMIAAMQQQQAQAAVPAR